MRVLIVEDEPRISAYVKRGLEEQGYAADAVYTGQEALEWTKATAYDLVVLDILLPELDGLSVCRELRRRGARVPILILTARDAVEDRVAGLDAGADDYLVKPFALSELLARLRALTRRSTASDKSSVLRVADLEMDTVTHRVRRAGKLIDLTAKEHAVLGGQLLQAFGTYSALPLAQESLAAAVRQEATFATLPAPGGEERIRCYTEAVSQGGRPVAVIQVLESLSNVDDALERLLAAFLVGGPLLALGAALGGYTLVAHALAPVDQMTRTARGITAGDLSGRLGLPATDDEIGRLAGTFDEMLAGLDDAFRRERRFAADASHELRTPLAAMQAILSVTQERRRTPEEYEAALADLAEETNRLRGLVDDLLRLARGQKQGISVRVEVDLSTLLADLTDSLRPLAEEKGLSLACDVPSGLTLSADRDALIRAFVNLLGNALKYTEQGSIAVRAWAEPGGVHVSVTDTGIGIPPEHLAHIFDRFYRVDRGGAERGTGLGLALAQEIVRAHGGTLTAESMPGAGSTFTVFLPR